jgi:hypothetical protein
VPWVPIYDVGRLGILADPKPHTLPPEAWTSGGNVRFAEGNVLKVQGYDAYAGAPLGTPYWLLPVVSGGIFLWIYPSLDKVFVTDGATHKEITKAATTYAATEALGWTGGVLGGIPILNNGVNPPQMWTPVDFGTPGLLQNLTAWPVAATARVLRVFKQFLIALGYTNGAGDTFDHMVKWSHPAEPGAVPITWDEADATKLAGEFDLAETKGAVVDCLPLGDLNVIYKEDSIWGMRHQPGSVFVFDIFQLPLGSVGALSRNCIREYRGKHLVFGLDDIVIHDGQTIDSILYRRLRRWLAARIDADVARLSFVALDEVLHEIWFGFPELGEVRPTLALTWNVRENTFGVRELPGIAYPTWGLVGAPGGGGTWADQTYSWAEAGSRTWGLRQFALSDRGLVGAAPGGAGALYRFNSGETANGTPFTSYVERESLALVGRGLNGEPHVDFNRVKLCRGVVPHLESSGPIQVSVGGQHRIEDPIAWTGPQAFDPSTQDQVNCAVEGRFISIRFESTADIRWRLDGYDMDIELLGER